MPRFAVTLAQCVNVYGTTTVDAESAEALRALLADPDHDAWNAVHEVDWDHADDPRIVYADLVDDMDRTVAEGVLIGVSLDAELAA